MAIDRKAALRDMEMKKPMEEEALNLDDFGGEDEEEMEDDMEMPGDDAPMAPEEMVAYLEDMGYTVTEPADEEGEEPEMEGEEEPEEMEEF